MSSLKWKWYVTAVSYVNIFPNHNFSAPVTAAPNRVMVHRYRARNFKLHFKYRSFTGALNEYLLVVFQRILSVALVLLFIASPFSCPPVLLAVLHFQLLIFLSSTSFPLCRPHSYLGFAVRNRVTLVSQTWSCCSGWPPPISSGLWAQRRRVECVPQVNRSGNRRMSSTDWVTSHS